MSKQPFDRVVTEHGPTVLRVCRAVLGPDDAQDAWSETFLAALRAYPDLPASANIQAWLVTIAHRKAIDVTRARRRSAVPSDRVPDGRSTVGLPGGADDELWTAVAALPDKQRHAIAYHYLAGLPHQQVADLLGGTADAARRAAADGIRTLRRAYPEPGATSSTAPGNGIADSSAPPNTNQTLLNSKPRPQPATAPSEPVGAHHEHA